MKTLILFLLAIIAGTGFNPTQAKEADAEQIKSQAQSFSKLVINADVIVVLLDDWNASIQVIGNESLKTYVTLTYSNDSLKINCGRKMDLRTAGLIYIPVNRVRNLQVNSEARICSLEMLDVTKLDIVVNGPCEFEFSHSGPISITGTENFTVDQTIQERRRRRPIVHAVNYQPSTAKM